MKIAIATQDLKTVDAHFAGARTFAIYEVSTEGTRMLEAIRFDAASNEDGNHGDDMDDRITPRLEAIRGCQLLFVRAIGLAIENRTGLIAQPLIKLSHEGWGRVVLIAGKLVVVSKSLRDVHRFGFLTLAKLAEEGSKLVEQGVACIDAYPEAARA